MAYRFSGVVLDWYDDKGDMLKEKFPNIDDLPPIIKQANIRPKEKLANEEFALVAIDGGQVLRKYACHDPGTTAMSVIYFMDNHDKLPAEAQKIAAANLVDACLSYRITPPIKLVKMSGVIDRVLNRLGGSAAKGAVDVLKPEIAPAAQLAGREAAQEAIRGGSKAVQDEIAKTILRLAGTSAIGAVGGGMTAPEDSRAQGAMRGAGGGLLGGLLGGSIGRVIKPSTGTNIGGAIGSLGGGMLAGASDPRRSLASLSIPGLEVAVGPRPEVPMEPQQPNVEVIAPGSDEKMASSRIVDITGKQAPIKIKTAEPTVDSDYAVIMPDGSKYYPLNTWDRVKTAEVYFQENKVRMHPEMRRQFAVKLAAKAHQIGFPLDEDIEDAGSTLRADDGHLQAALEMRKVACAPGDDRAFLDELFEKRATVEPDVYAEVLRRFDVSKGLDKGWDHVVLDPWSSTFGMNKVAEVVWEDGPERVTSEELSHLALEHGGALRDVYGEKFTDEFMKDPIGIFNSLPLTWKRQLARLAQNMKAIGSTENNTDIGPKKSDK